jgi:hypothetical protein
MILNFERGTVYRNCGLTPNGDFGDKNGSYLTLIKRGAEGGAAAARTVLPGFYPQHEYQWSAFHRLVRGDRTLTVVEPEVVAAGVRIIEAMAAADAGAGWAAVSAKPSPEGLWAD